MQQSMPIYGKNFEFDTLYKSDLGGEAKKCGNILLYQFGDISCVQNYYVPLHKQWCHEISFVIEGEGSFSTDGETVVLKTGDIHFCPSGSLHSVKASENTDLRYGYFGFDFDGELNAESVEGALKKFYENLKTFSAHDNHSVFQVFFRCLDELYNNGQFINDMMNAYLLQILILVYRDLANQPYTEYYPNIEATGSKRAVYLISQYIIDHILEDINVGELAKTMGYNTSYFSTVFKKVTGITISQFISKVKIQKSVEMLQNGKCSISKAAQMLNFASVQSFNKAFKRNMGVSPMEYLKYNLKK